MAQNADRGKMYQFERGFGDFTSRIYNVSRITSRSISLWRGERDALATPIDVEILKSDLTGE